jgi:hypothetical protein
MGVIDVLPELRCDNWRNVTAQLGIQFEERLR